MALTYSTLLQMMRRAERIQQKLIDDLKEEMEKGFDFLNGRIRDMHTGFQHYDVQAEPVTSA